jgi:hypothetical protein
MIEASNHGLVKKQKDRSSCFPPTKARAIKIFEDPKHA